MQEITRTETTASLWSAPTGPLPASPIQTKAPVLPIGELAYDDAERLFTRLLANEPNVERASLFGLPGQKQDGIDAYAKRRPGAGAIDKMYVALQSRRVRKLGPGKIRDAARDFLAGDWAMKCSHFYYATSAPLRETGLDEAVRDAEDLLLEHGVTFVAWGAEEVSDLLRHEPRIVDDFFGREWVKDFCGEESAKELSRRLSTHEARALRTELKRLYRSAFAAQGGVPVPSQGQPGRSYLMLDTQPIIEAPAASATSANVRAESTESDASDEFAEEDVFGGAPRWARRRTVRPRRELPTTRRVDGVARTPADRWAEQSHLSLLIGLPGTGKSRFLMFAATDILAEMPQSAPLQRAHAGNLPLWLPFAFLCAHLAESTSNSVLSAIESWITRQGGDEAWRIVKPALDDERALLLVDGIDEWSDQTEADNALGLVESFVSLKQIGAILTARPYALERLHWTNDWSRAQLAPLTYEQQLDIVHRSLSDQEALREAGPTPEAVTFLSELSGMRDLEGLLTTPLFLALLSRSWRGESLPSQRLKLYSALIRLLEEHHPQMRRRASSVSGADFSRTQMQTALRGVAFATRLSGPAIISSRNEMEARFREELQQNPALAFPPFEAAKIANAMLTQAEDEYGIIVPQGGGMVGFLHRVLLDQLAGEHLATLPPDEMSDTVIARTGDPAWRDVLLASLGEQVNAHINLSALEQMMRDETNELADRYELLAAAIASDVPIPPASQASWVDEIISRVADLDDFQHRATLAGSLVTMTKHEALRDRLLSTFASWLKASHPEPIGAIWELRRAEVDRERALKTLFWALKHEEEVVQLNAAHAIAVRFGGDADVRTKLVARIAEAPAAIDQAFALLSLGTGWPQAPEIPSLVEWARTQLTPELRICALHLLAKSARTSAVDLTADEQAWLRTFLHHERLTPHDHWKDMVGPFIQNVVAGDDAEAAFVLETLAKGTRTDGDRFFAWFLACTTFQDVEAIRHWVAEQLSLPGSNRLILHDLALIPASWKSDPEFAAKAAATVRHDAAESFAADVVPLSRTLPEKDALEALLPGLDAFRPVRVAAELLNRFGEDPSVQTALRERLFGPLEKACRMAPLALDALGLEEGFELLVDLLRRSEGIRDLESRVVVSNSVAEGWSRLRASEDKPVAAKVMARYDPDELAARCVAVGTAQLTWHVSSVIAAWPDSAEVIQFALNALEHPGQLSSGVIDPAPTAIFRTYGPRSNAAARKVVEATFDQLAYLPSSLREVLVASLAQSDLRPAVLSGFFSNWSDDPDIWVQRAAITGLVRRYDRYRLTEAQDGTEATGMHVWLQQQVRSQLCAYGRDHDEQRQTAWVAMLLLDEPELHDGLQERIGEPTRPGTRLWQLSGGADQELVELVSANWRRLYAHFGDELFQLLSGSRGKDRDMEDSRREVLRHLATSPVMYPDITTMIVMHAEFDALFRLSREYLLWAHRNGRTDLELLLAYSDAISDADLRGGGSEFDQLYDAVLDTRSWNIDEYTFKAALTEAVRREGTATLRALFSELYPSDEQSLQMLHDLEVWFEVEGPRPPREWIDTLVVAVRVSPAELVPVIVERALNQLRLVDVQEFNRFVLSPLRRRLYEDPAAVAAMRNAARCTGDLSADTPIWRNVPPSTGHSYAGRTFLFGLILQRAGLLDEATTSSMEESFETSDQNTIVFNPYTSEETSLKDATRLLSKGRREDTLRA